MLYLLLTPLALLCCYWPSLLGGDRQFEKMGRLEELTSSVEAWGHGHLQGEFPSELAIDDIQLRQIALREGRMPRRRNTKESNASSAEFALEQRWQRPFVPETAHGRLVRNLLDRRFHDPTVHPRRDFRHPVRVSLSMSLYQILEVDERRQSIVANVWMVQDWLDEFLDWDPNDYEGINKTIVPCHDIWVPDTVLYNSEDMDRRNTEALMNAIVETGHWRADGQGAAVQLMFPAIYKLSCRMDVRFFPYDQQNCSFIISSWTHDSSSIDYQFARPTVNMLNFAQNDEWTVVSFEFQRVEEQFKCCPRPWTMLYAHLVIRRKPLYYILNLVVPTSIITCVAITGFFTPSSSSSERDEKLYLGINTLLTMSLMVLMVTSEMPNTSNYVPLMAWYYMGIIFVIVFGTVLATMVLLLHSRKSRLRPLPGAVLRLLTRPTLWVFVLEPPASLREIWTEFGLLTSEKGSQESPEGGKNSVTLDKMLQGLPNPSREEADLQYERQLVLTTRRFALAASRAVGQQRRRRETIVEAADFLSQGVIGCRKKELHMLQRQLRRQSRLSFGGAINSRLIKRQRLMRRCALEWEFLANFVDRCLLALFAAITCFFFCLLSFYDWMFAWRFGG